MNCGVLGRNPTTGIAGCCARAASGQAGDRAGHLQRATASNFALVVHADAQVPPALYAFRCRPIWYVISPSTTTVATKPL
jgi:hypothetical protein